MICPFRKLGCNGHHSGEKTDLHVNLLLRKILDLEKKFVDVDFSKLPRTDDREPTCDQGADEPSHETMLPVENGLTRAAYSPPYIGVPRMGAPTRDPRGALFRSSPRYSVGLLAEDSRPGSVESSCAPSANPTVTAAGSLPQRQRQQQTQKYTRQRQLRQIQEQEPEQPHNAQRKQNQGNERALSRIPHPVSEQKRRGASTPTLTIVSLEHPESVDGAMSFPTQWSRWKTHPSTTASITTAFIPPHVSEQELSASQQRTNRLIRRQNKNMLRKNARQFRTTPNGRGKTKKKKNVALELSAQEVGGDGDHDHAMVPRARRALDPYIVHAGNNAEKSAAGSAFEDCNAVDSASTSMSTNASTGDGAHVSSSESSVEVETGPPSSWAAVGVGRTPHHVHAHFEQQSTPIVTQFTSSNTASANTASLSHWKGVQLPSGKTFHAFANDAQQLLARTGKARSPPAMMIFATPPATPSTSSRNESISRRKARAFGREDDPYGFITDLADEDKAGESAKASAHQPSSPSYGSQPTKAASKDDIGEKVAKQNASTTRPASARKSSAPIAGWREFGGHESENGGEADRLGNYGEELKTMEIDIGTQSITLGSRETAAKGKKRPRTKTEDYSISISKQLLRREITYSEALESFKRLEELPDSDALNAALCAMQVLSPEDETAIKYLDGIKGEAARLKAHLYRGKIYRNLAKNAVNPMSHLVAALSEYDAVLNSKTMSANDHLKAASARESILHQLGTTTSSESVRKRPRHQA